MRSLSISHGFLALVLLTGCTTDATVLVDFTGTLTDADPAVGAIDSGWVVVEIDGELITTRTGQDGSFTVPALPSEAPMTVTFAAEDRVAVTWQGLTLADLDLPVEVRSCRLIDPMAYEPPIWSISGTVSGAPVGSYVLLYGESDYHDYVYASSTDPVPFAFDAVAWDEGYTFSALALEATGYQTLAVGVATATGSDPVDVVLTTEHSPLQVSSTRPDLDGVPMNGLATEYCMQLAYTHPADAWSAVTGWNTACRETGEGFEFEVDWYPVGGPARLDLTLVESPESTASSFASVPLADGQAEVHIEPLDAPRLAHHDELAAGGTVAWDPVDGATDYLFYADDGEHVRWYIVPYADEEVSLPRLPEDFDTSLIGADHWSVQARHAIWDDEGLDPDEPYLYGITDGGVISW